jgi:type I restriction enzyme S subunit
MNLTENAAKIILFKTEKEYLKLILSSDLCQNQFMQSTKGMAQPKLALKRIENTIIPIPCIEEQKEIVTIVNKLLNFCDELEKKIEKRGSYQERIMQAVVKQAFTTKIETVETE